VTGEDTEFDSLTKLTLTTQKLINKNYVLLNLKNMPL
jgi:hypothetical protein